MVAPLSFSADCDSMLVGDCVGMVVYVMFIIEGADDVCDAPLYHLFLPFNLKFEYH